MTRRPTNRQVQRRTYTWTRCWNVTSAVPSGHFSQLHRRDLRNDRSHSKCQAGIRLIMRLFGATICIHVWREGAHQSLSVDASGEPERG